MECVKQGDLSRVQKLLEEDDTCVNIIIQGSDYMTPLHLAVQMGQYEMVKLLLEHGAEPDGLEGNYPTLLVSALERNHCDITRLLLEYGADVNRVDHKERTPCVVAVHHCQPETIRVLCSFGCKLEQVDSCGRTACMYAALLGRREVFKVLIECGANINAVDRRGRTALLMACYHEYLDIPSTAGSVVQLLVEHGADLEIRDELGCTALMVAVICGDGELCKMLVEAGANTQCADWSTLDADNTDILDLLKNSTTSDTVSYDAQKVHQDTLNRALQNGAKYTRYRQVKVALTLGADISFKDEYFNTLLMLAVNSEHTNDSSVVELLCHHDGIDVNARDVDDWTALHHACHLKNLSAVSVLLRSGKAQVDLTDNGGQTAVLLACCRKDAGIVRLLAEYGANLEIHCHIGITPLMFSVMDECGEVCRVLVEFGASVRNVSGKKLKELMERKDEYPDYGYLDFNR